MKNAVIIRTYFLIPNQRHAAIRNDSACANDRYFKPKERSYMHVSAFQPLVTAWKQSLVPNISCLSCFYFHARLR